MKGEQKLVLILILAFIKNQTTPARFELAPQDENGLAGRRVNHSATVSILFEKVCQKSLTFIYIKLNFFLAYTFYILSLDKMKKGVGYLLMVSIHRPSGYEPNTLPLRQGDILYKHFNFRILS